MGRNVLRGLGIALGLAPTAALAHVGAGQASGVMHSFMHPLGGIDHLLAMILVGVFAYQLGRKALVLLPLSFIALMALGGLAGLAGLPLPFVEIGIALSIVVLGLAVAFGVNAPVALAVALVGAFAVFHGHAHGTEMPMGVSGAAYGLGFVVATALLHLIGIGAGVLIGTLGMRYGKSFHRVAAQRPSVWPCWPDFRTHTSLLAKAAPLRAERRRLAGSRSLSASRPIVIRRIGGKNTPQVS